MASPYQDVEYLINKLRSTFILNNSDERNVIKPFKANSMLQTQWEDDFTNLSRKQNSPPISFNYNKLNSQLNDIESISSVPEQLLDRTKDAAATIPGGASSTLKETLRVEEPTINNETAASQVTIKLDMHNPGMKQNDSLKKSFDHSDSLKKLQEVKSESLKKSSNNLIKTNFNRLFRVKSEDSIDETEEYDADLDKDDRFHDDDLNDNNDDRDDTESKVSSNRQGKVTHDSSVDIRDDNNTTSNDSNSLTGSLQNDDTSMITNPEFSDITNGENYELSQQQDDLTKIDHDNLSDDDDDDDVLKRYADDDYDGDDSSHFLTDSDLTDSDAFLVDDSFYGSGASLLANNNSSGNLLLYRGGANNSVLDSSVRKLRHHQRTRTLEKSYRDKKKSVDDLAQSIKSERYGVTTRSSSPPGGSKRSSKSYSNLLAMANGALNNQQLPPSQQLSLPQSSTAVPKSQFTYKTELAKPELKSNLTLMLHQSANVDKSSALEYFKFVGEGSGSKLATITVYFPSTINSGISQVYKISRSTLVKDFIGYILLGLKSKEFILKDKDLGNPNYWCLRIMDDNEIDEDFGPLDRNKPIIGFGVSEVLLQQVTPQIFRQNEKQFPLPKLFVQALAASSANAGSNSTTSLTKDQSSSHYKMKSLIPEEIEDEFSRNGGITLPSKSTNFLRDKNLEESEMDRLNYNKKDELKKKFVSSYKQRSFLSSSTKPTSKISASFTQQPFSLANDNSENGLTTSSFFKWTVWRHNQLSFKNRHERSLSIDGEYIYIIPESTIDHENVAYKYLVDANNMKTTSFHVSQIIKCKQSRKYPTHLKIVVMKPAGPKRYDLELLDAIQCEEIVRLIKNLVNAYTTVTK